MKNKKGKNLGFWLVVMGFWKALARFRHCGRNDMRIGRGDMRTGRGDMGRGRGDRGMFDGAMKSRIPLFASLRRIGIFRIARWKSMMTSFLIFLIFFTQAIPYPVAVFLNSVGVDELVAEAASADAPEAQSPQITFDLVVLVVDNKVFADTQSYVGLQNSYSELDGDSFRERIMRYAEDLKNSNPLLDVKILQFNSDHQGVPEIVNALENIYMNGTDGRNNQLTGVVLIGDVPLPVVEKNGNRYISMFPYTDFLEKAYIYNSQTENFERNPNVAFPKAELWHGVITPSSNDQAGWNEMAEYFDKNHLFYQGHPDFADFERKMFFADLVSEEKNLSEYTFERYLKYTEALDDIEYMRYNKYWANELTQSTMGEIPINEENPEALEFSQAIQDSDPATNLPDLYAKNIVDAQLFPYYKLLQKFVGQINDIAESTGRYQVDEVDNIPALISMKDKYAARYLKTVNDALEAEVNEMVEAIQEPMPIIEHTRLTGQFEDGESFTVEITVDDAFAELGNLFNTETVQVFYRFHYFNEVLNKLYVNGIEADIMSGPLQCSVYLGSTKDEYFDNDLNFNPKAVDDGEYSILTRALRTTNVSTNLPLPTAGINTRMISPSENFDLTGVAAVGAIVENNLDYGVAAFAPNPMHTNYANPWEADLNIGDVIVEVNGQELSDVFTFDDAIKKSYSDLMAVKAAINTEDDDFFDNYEPQILILDNSSLGDADVGRISANIGMKFYRGNQLREAGHTYTINKNGTISNDDPTGDPEVLVLQSDIGFEEISEGGFSLADFLIAIATGIVDFDTDKLDPDKNTEGALFSLYDMRDEEDNSDHNGYDTNGYDNSAGCNQNQANENSDRCFPMMATMPVLDPVGAYPLMKTFTPDGEKLMFPEYVKRVDGENSTEAADYEDHMNLFQYPENYALEDVDEVIMNSCYKGLVGLDDLEDDSNPYEFPLDADTFTGNVFSSLGFGEAEIGFDIYGRYLKSVGEFVDDYGSKKEISPFKDEIWQNIDEITADDIVLNNADGPTVTLKMFSDHYGLFDGIDNDGDCVGKDEDDEDCIRDYKFRDLDDDGFAETQWWDFDEADPAYGIPEENLDEIARKMLSHPSKFVIPAGVSPLDQELTLFVQPTSYKNKEISSAIYHVEPTAYTISQQVKAQTAFSLPIDDPRYVAFQAKPEDPVDSNSHYYPGELVKVDYVNLFDIGNAGELQTALDELAVQLATTPGSYRIFGENVNPDDYSAEQIKNEVLGRLQPIVSGQNDDPLTGFDLKVASGAKLADAMEWVAKNVDEKHDYVLEYYLNPTKNAYIADETLYPAPFGYSATRGYESTYLVLDGEEDYFDMNFNKDVPEETDVNFDPLQLYQGQESITDEEFGPDDDSGGGSAAEDGVWIWLDDFLEESVQFIEDLENLVTEGPSFENACEFSEGMHAALEAGEDGLDFKKELTRLEIDVERTVMTINDSVKVTVRGYDENDQPLSGGDRVTLDLVQNVDNPVVEVQGTNPTVLASGLAEFELVSLEESGNVVISADGENGTSSGVIQISVTKKGVNLVSSTYSIPTGYEDVEVVDDNPFVDATVNPESKYVVEARDSMVANGDSLMMISAQILDEDGVLESDKTHQVEFSIVEGEDLVSFDGSSLVSSVSGEAVTYLKAGTKSGEIVLQAEVDGAGYPVVQKELFLVAGDPASIEIVPDSFSLVANGQSKSLVNFVIRDEFGNVANDSFAQLTLFLDSNVANFGSGADESGALIGTQISTIEGVAGVELFAGDQPGEIRLFAVLMDFELEEQFLASAEQGQIDFTAHVGKTAKFTVLDDVDLELSWDKDTIVADGSSVAKLKSELLHNGNVVSDYNGPVEFTILNENLGYFVNVPPEKMVDGVLHEQNVRFRGGTKTGDVEILVDVPGFASDTARLTLVAGDPAQIELKASSDVIYSDAGNQVEISASVLDEYGNLVEQENETVVSFDETDASEGFMDFVGEEEVLSQDGVASVNVIGGRQSGDVNLIASSSGLDQDIISLKVAKRIMAANVQDYQPRSLYMSVLGGAYGNVDNQNSIGQQLLYSGQVQAVGATTSSAISSKKLIGVDAYGKIDLMSDMVDMEYVGATESLPYQKIIFADGLNGVELASLIVVPKTTLPLVLVEDEEDMTDNQGIYVERVSMADPDVKLVERSDGIYAEKGGEDWMKIDQLGRISLLNDGLSVGYPDVDVDNIDPKEFSLVVYDRGVVLALVTYRQKFAKDVGVIAPGDVGALTAGFYIQKNTLDSRFEFESGFSRASSHEQKGFYLVDTESQIDSGQAPGFGYESLEHAGERFGVGFQGDNKHMLFFAGGNSVGESHLPYSSEVGIVLGDPMIRLDVEGQSDLISSLSGFTKDIGKPIFSGRDNIKEMFEFEFNGDGLADIMIIYDDGLIRVLENLRNSSEFKDLGYVLNVFGGITSSAAIDINGDGFDDLILGTKESCAVEEDVHFSQYMNIGAGFENESLGLKIEGKPLKMKGHDMNVDGCEDLVVSDEAGNIRIFYNRDIAGSCSGLEKNHGLSRNFGIELEPDVNLVDALYVNYAGMSSSENMIQFVLESDAPNLTALELGMPDLGSTETLDFINIVDDSRLGLTSLKKATDLNGNSVKPGDKIRFEIVLTNSSSSAISDLILSDLMPGNMTVIDSSLECLDSGCADTLRWLETGVGQRPFVITGISVPASGIRRITYSMTVESVPEVGFDIGNDFATYPNNNNDGYPDIFVKPRVNPDGLFTYLYSTGLVDGKVNYSKHIVSPEGSDPGLLSDILEQSGLPPGLAEVLGAASNPNYAPSQDMADQMNQMIAEQNKDSDFDGLIDSWGAAYESFTDTAKAVEGLINDASSLFQCSGGGCLPIPYNYAFFAPSDILPGYPMLSLNAKPPYIYPPLTPNTVPSEFRLYANPTLTMGLGGGICVGPSTGNMSPCVPFAVPISKLGVCDALLGPINDAINEGMAYMKNTLADPDIGLATIVSDGTESTATDAMSSSGGFSDPDFPVSVNHDVNVRIPGFPSVITNWMDAQIDEIYNKLLDLPDFYFIYPTINGLISDYAISSRNFEKIAGIHDFLRAVNSMPLITIEGKEVTMRIPAISSHEIEKYKNQAEAWLRYEEQELQKIADFWQCNIDNDRKTLCDLVTVQMTEMILSVQQVMDKLDMIANLPRDILTWRQLEAKYAQQIICYLDAIIQYTGGYMRKQQKTIESWLIAVEDVIRTVKDWGVLFDLIIEYQESCDQCKSDRFSKLGLLLQLFVAIPDPPVIAFPKWPDIVFDMSQIRAGIKIVWPDLIFRPEPIRLPDLPVVTLPTYLPEFTLELPPVGIPGIELPDWMKNFPTVFMPEFPDLPPLPLPDLPDLPRPPKIPKIPDVVMEFAANIKTIFKILCLLKNGIIIIPEGSLATEIETLTQPTIQVVLPFIKHLSLKMPAIEYDYLEQIKITARMNFGIDTNFIYLAVKRSTEVMNKLVDGLVDEVNQYTRAPFQEVIDNIIRMATEKAIDAAVEAATGIQEAADEAVSEAAETTGEAVDAAEDEVTFNFDEYGPEIAMLEANYLEMHKELEVYAAEMAEIEYPETIHLTAKPRYLDKTDPLLNRSIAEVEYDIQNRELEAPEEIASMVALRDSLIDYAKNLEDSNQALESIENIEDLNSVSKILVEHDQKVPRLANIGSDQILDALPTEAVATEFFGDATDELVSEAKRYLAADIQINPDEIAAQMSTRPVTPPKGFFVVIDGQSENILTYTAELSKPMEFIYSDVDEDTDIDIVYSMGGDVYLKRNYEQSVDYDEGELSNDALEEYVVEMGSVQGMNSPYKNHEAVDISWESSFDKDVRAYEIRVYSNKLAEFEDYVYLYTALIDDPESDEGIETMEILGIDEVDEFVFKLDNPDSPSVSLEMPNGDYYVRIMSVDDQAEYSIISDMLLISPQACADQDAPFPVLESTEYVLPLFKTLEISAESSFDTSGEIKEYYIEVLPYNSGGKPETELPLEYWSDMNQAWDSGNDGITTNDKDNPVFRIGPFENEGDIGTHEMILHVVDQIGNSSELPISIEVVVPDISLDSSFATTTVAEGEVDPALDKIPFSLVRERLIHRVVDGQLSLVPDIQNVYTDSIGDKDKYYTLPNGKYEISDFDLDNMILVENGDGEIVAEVHPETGNIGALAEGHYVLVLPAEVPDLPTRIEVYDADGNLLFTMYAVADPNIDVSIYDQFNFDNVDDLAGVHVSDDVVDDAFEFRKIPADDLEHPGAAVLVYTDEDKDMVIIDSSGNIIVLDDRINLIQKANSHINDPFLIEIQFEGQTVATVYIGALTGDKVVKIGSHDIIPFANPRAPSAASIMGTDLRSRILGIEDRDLRLIAKDLLALGVIDGLRTPQGIIINPGQPISRKDFVKTLLMMLCIVPRDEAYLPYSENEADGGFSDIYYNAENLDPYYPFIKEAALRGLIEGYLGEVDPASGLVPFKPDSQITRAEAIKIILETLELTGYISLEGVQKGEPWYLPYLEIAMNLDPYELEGRVLKNNSIITDEEADNPGFLLTYEDAILISQKVIEIFSCFDFDSDGDGMSDYCEEKYGIDDPDADPDGDGLTNLDECYYGSDPLNDDSDGGGVNDGEEIEKGTNPNDPGDDPIDSDGDGLINNAEILYYKTDPNKADTDEGGVNDGEEVGRGTDPLDPSDDFDDGRFGEIESGVYLVPADCNSCPCQTTFLHSADVIPGDIFFTVISSFDDSQVFAKSEEVEIESINKNL